MDASVLMDREDKLKDWPNKKDSDIATEIFRRLWTDAASRRHRRESTTSRFRRSSSARPTSSSSSGWRCAMATNVTSTAIPATSRRRRLSGTTQPVLAVQFGDDTNVNRFRIEVNALAPANVAMFQVDRDSKDVLDATRRPAASRRWAPARRTAYLGAGMSPGVVYVGKDGDHGQPRDDGPLPGPVRRGRMVRHRRRRSRGQPVRQRAQATRAGDHQGHRRDLQRASTTSRM